MLIVGESNASKYSALSKESAAVLRRWWRVVAREGRETLRSRGLGFSSTDVATANSRPFHLWDCIDQPIPYNAVLAPEMCGQIPIAVASLIQVGRSTPQPSNWENKILLPSRFDL